MSRPTQVFLDDLPNRLDRQAAAVEADGFLTAARLMREAADELRIRREDTERNKYSTR